MSLLPFEGAIEGVIGVINKFIPDKAAQEAAKAQVTENMLALASQADAAQDDINKIEAAGNWFEAGWRPFIGWTCGLAFAGHYVWTPSFLFLRSCWQGVCVAPVYDMTELNTVLYALLGIGGLRTVDKSIGYVMKALK